jgi:hypothetical protein
MSKANLFDNELTVLSYYAELSKKEGLTVEEYQKEMNKICEHYSELLDQSKLVTKVSDKLQNKLNLANESLELKNTQLQETIDELTKARASKKATTIVLFMAVILFLFSEGLIDPIIDDYTSSLFIGLSIKGLIALLIKPIEYLIENFILKTAVKNISANAKPA